MSDPIFPPIFPHFSHIFPHGEQHEDEAGLVAHGQHRLERPGRCRLRKGDHPIQGKPAHTDGRVEDRGGKGGP